MNTRNNHRHDPAPLSLYNQNTATSHYLSDHKNHGQENTQNNSLMGLQCLDKHVLAQGGGGGGGTKSTTSQESLLRCSPKLKVFLKLGHIPETSIQNVPELPANVLEAWL